MKRTVVLNVVGLTKSLIGEPTPHLSSFSGGCAEITTTLPAVTCPMQTTYLTGALPAEHGIVGNGWYSRELDEVLFWRQSNLLVQKERLWQTARRRDQAFTVANTFWWFAMNTDADITVTPRPIYCADGRKLPDCYSKPAGLRRRFNSDFGQFPLFRFWGPATSIESSEWIGRSAMAIEMDFSPTLQLIYLPHLDYVLQRVGSSGEIAGDLKEIDDLCGRLIAFFRERGCRVVILSEYGISDVNTPIHPNRILRSAGLLAVKTDLGREYLDQGGSRAFAVADHQVAHVYIKDQHDIPAVAELFAGTVGVDRVLGRDGKKEHGVGHERSGDLVLIADRESWFTYYFWNDDTRAPDYGRTIDIHAKPGYDPCELFIDPQIRFPRLKVASILAKKLLGFRYLLNVIPLDATLVKGSHGRVVDDPRARPVCMTSEPKLLESPILAATDVHSLLLRHLFSE